MLRLSVGDTTEEPVSATKIIILKMSFRAPPVRLGVGDPADQ
jgi:hypothetical protein